MNTDHPKSRTRAPRSATYVKGDVWYVVDDPEHDPIGSEMWANRPGLIVSNDLANRYADVVQIVYLTTATQLKANPTTVPVGSPLPNGRPNLALCGQIHTVSKLRLSKHLGRIDAEAMNDVDDALALSLSIHHNTGYGVYKKWESYLKKSHVNLQSELDALSAQTTDERVKALTAALRAVTADRDAYRQLYENSQQIPELLSLLPTTQKD